MAVGEETGPATGQPPAVSNETKAALANAAESSATGSHVPGKNAAPVAGEGEQKVKSEKERMNPIHMEIVSQANPRNKVERERKKAEKQAKFDQKKQAQKASAASAAPSKNKEKKAKAEKKAAEEVLPKYVEDTPEGEKKSMSIRLSAHVRSKS